MSLWFVLALMTLAAVFAVLWPLSRREEAVPAGSETLVYKDQLAEVSRDAASGLIGSEEAVAARTEISRRLLAAAATEQAGLPQRTSAFYRRAASVVALVGLPLLAVTLYLRLGFPALPDAPLIARLQQSPHGSGSVENLVERVQTALEKNPADGRGWSVLAPVLLRLGRVDEAVQAFRKSLALNGESAARHSDLGEALVMAANGVVTAEAKAEFDRAIALDSNDVKARYFTGVAAEQDGHAAQAAEIWRAMLASAPQEASWRPFVEEALVRVGSVGAPTLSSEQVAAAKGMTETDRGAMIQGMVNRLADRLKTNKDDVDGWLRLVRAYLVLGERDKAVAVSGEARQGVAGQPERLRQLNDGLKELGLEG